MMTLDTLNDGTVCTNVFSDVWHRLRLASESSYKGFLCQYIYEPIKWYLLFDIMWLCTIQYQHRNIIQQVDQSLCITNGCAEIWNQGTGTGISLIQTRSSRLKLEPLSGHPFYVMYS